MKGVPGPAVALRGVPPIGRLVKFRNSIAGVTYFTEGRVIQREGVAGCAKCTGEGQAVYVKGKNFDCLHVHVGDLI